MKLPKFELFSPSSLAEAARCLAAKGNQARLIAGGTDLLVRMKQGTDAPELLINLKSIAGLSGIACTAERGMIIGAMTKLRDVAASADVKRYYPELARAASAVASAQIRNAGTLGGNICLEPKCYFLDQSVSWWGCGQECRKRGGDRCYIIPASTRGCFALMSADTVPALIAYRASVKLTGPDGERVIALEDLYTGTGIGHLTLKSGEILTEANLPPVDAKVAFMKYSPRNTIDFADVSVAVSMRQAPAEARIVLGSIASAPVRPKAAESLLAQSPAADADEVGRLAAEKSKIVSWVRGQTKYKKHMVHVLIRDAVRRLQATATA